MFLNFKKKSNGLNTNVKLYLPVTLDYTSRIAFVNVLDQISFLDDASIRLLIFCTSASIKVFFIGPLVCLADEFSLMM